MKRILIPALAALFGVAAAQPRSATHADSGWVPLFDGKDWAGLFVYAKGTGAVKPETQTNYALQDGIISVQGSPGGYLGTIRQYSHYHVRVSYRWPAGTPANANSGLLIHLDSAAVQGGGEKDAGRPRSIEINCRRDNNYPWSLWSAQNLGPYITTTVTAIPATDVQGQFNPAGIAWTDDPWSAATGRVISGDFQANPEAAIGQWNLGEAYVYGDSGAFVLNGQVRTRGWNFRMPLDPKAPTAHLVPCTSGNIGLQSEGYPIQFKDFEIQELDSATRLPIHARRGCTDRNASNYDARAVVDDLSCAGTAVLPRARASARQAPRVPFGVDGRRMNGKPPGFRALLPRPAMKDGS